MAEQGNVTPLIPPAVRVAEASRRVLDVIEERGTPEQVERVRQSIHGSTPPPANHPTAWPIFAAEAMAALAEIVADTRGPAEPKRGPGRPRKGR